MVTKFKTIVVCVQLSCNLGSGYQIFEGMCCFCFQDKSDFCLEFIGSVLVSNHSSIWRPCVSMQPQMNLEAVCWYPTTVEFGGSVLVSSHS